MHDAIIVGGGLVGCLTALRLADAGRHCLIVDSDDGDGSASANSAGGIYLQLQPLLAADAIVQAHAEALAPLVRASFSAWMRLAERIPAAPLTVTGGLVVAFGLDDMAVLRRKHALEHRLGLHSALLGPADIRRDFPELSPAVVGGCYVANEGHCEPATLLRLLRDALRRSGVEIRQPLRVKSLSDRRHCVRVAFEDADDIEARSAILATGGFTDTMLEALGLPHGIRSFPIQMMSVRPPVDLRIRAMTRAVGRKISLKTVREDAIWIGGGWEAAGYDRADHRVQLSAEHERHNHSTAAELVPALATAVIERRWGGLVAWTSDGLPIIGRVPAAPNVLLACGGNGFSLAPIYAELLSNALTGGSDLLDLDPFSPGRFATRAASATSVAPD